MPLEFRLLLHRLPRAFVLAAAVALPLGASAQDDSNPSAAQRTHASKAAPRDSKVLNGIQHGADATGRGIDHAGQATQHGVNTASERASRPIRHAGETLGRKLSPGSRGHAGPPAVGPQGSAP